MGTLSFLNDATQTTHRWAGASPPAAVVSLERQGGLAMINDYIEHLQRRRRAATTIRLRRYYVTSFSRVRWTLTAATHSDFDRWINSHQWAPATESSAIASVKGFYGWAHRTGLMPHDPTVELTPPMVPVTRRPIAIDSVLLDALDDATPVESAIILLGAECGLRVHEIAKVSTSDRDGEWLDVLGKGGKFRTVHLSPELIAHFEQIETTTMRHGHYFPGQSGKPMHPSTIWRIVNRMLDVNTHALRHRAATTVYRATKDIRVTQEFLGHSSPLTTARYVHVERDDLKRAGDAARLVRVAA